MKKDLVLLALLILLSPIASAHVLSGAISNQPGV